MDVVVKENKSFECPDLNARVDVNCGRKDGQTDGRETGRLYHTLLKQVRQ